MPRNRAVIVLRLIHQSWLKDGSPQILDPNRYTTATNTYSRLYPFTNAYSLKGENYEGLVAYENDDFCDKGFMLPARDGDILWMDKKKGPQLIKKAETVKQ